MSQDSTDTLGPEASFDLVSKPGGHWLLRQGKSQGCPSIEELQALEAVLTREYFAPLQGAFVFALPLDWKRPPELAVSPEWRRAALGVLRALIGLDLPLVFVLEGPVTGFGLELACLADLRIMSQTASLGEPELSESAAILLPGLLGRARALELSCRKVSLDAVTCELLGLATDFAAPEDLVALAEERLQELTKSSQNGFAHYRETLLARELQALKQLLS